MGARAPWLLGISLLVWFPGCTPTGATSDARLLEAIDWYTGVAGIVDDARARELLETVVEETGSPLSRMWLARVHSRGRMGFERDEARARAIAGSVIPEIRRLAETGEPEAVFLMGTAHDEGLGVEPDAQAAVSWYRAAAEHGHVLAQHNLGNAYAAGRGLESDPALAVHWWTRAAERGDAITQLRLGEAFEQGNGVAEDLAQALAWYTRSAERGNADAAAAVERLRRGLIELRPPPDPEADGDPAAPDSSASRPTSPLLAHRPDRAPPVRLPERRVRHAELV